MIRDRFASLRRTFRVHDPESEIEEELAFHFDETVAELVRGGMPRTEAEREARRRFGNREEYRRELRILNRRRAATERLEALWQDIRHAFRRMGRSPGLTIAIVLTFALGIGANATMFGIIDRLLLRAPDHVSDPAGVRRVVFEKANPYTGARFPNEIVSYPDFEDLVAAHSLAGVAAVSERTLTIGSGEEAQQLQSTLVTDGYFELLGVRPALGRFWTPEEYATAVPVAVIGYERWQNNYGGGLGVLGRTVDFGHGPYTIIGVAPRGFTGAELRPVDLWLPMGPVRDQLSGGSEWRSQRHWNSFRLIGRLAEGVTAGAAGAELTALHRNGRAEEIGTGRYDAEVRAVLAPLIRERGPFSSGESRVAIWLGGVSLIVLLIACANVANLLLARAIRQQREIGIRLALGVSRGRLLVQSLTESVVLAAIGGAGALVVAYWGGQVIHRVLLPGVAWGDAFVEVRVLALVVGLVLLAGVAAGLMPWVQSGRRDLLRLLAGGARSGGSPAGSRIRNSLTVLQAALSVVLLVGAGLFVRSLQRVDALDHGMEVRNVLLVSPVFERGIDDHRREAFYRNAVDRLNAMTGVAGATATLGTPFWSERTVSVQVPGLDSLPRLPGGGPYFHAVDHNYFRALGVPIVAGRSWGPRLEEGAGPVVVVNETMARHVWPGQDPLGRCLIIGDGDAPCAAVIGVAKDTRRHSFREPPAMQYFVSSEQGLVEALPEAVLVRTAGDPAALLPAISRELRAVEPAVRHTEIESLLALMAPEARPWRLGATMFGAFGLLALVVAAVGLYSVLAFSVSQRTQELGIRAALGAGRRRILGLVLGRGLRQASIGIVIGICLSLAAGRWIAGLLFETSPRDLVTFVAVAATLLLVALLAGVVPAWRASRIEPGAALRVD